MNLLKTLRTGALNTFANVFDYIPSPLVKDIRDGTSTAEVSGYVNDAMRASKEVYFPVGRYNVSLVEMYGNQTVRGAGRATQIVRNGTDPCFVSSEWLHNCAAVARGGTITNLSFSNGASLRGGFAIVGYNYDDRYYSLHLDGLGISLVASTQNGTSAHGGQTQNHHLIDIDVRNSPDGGLYCPNKVTDTFISQWAINNCGTADRYALDIFTLSGWHIYQNKAYACPGGIVCDRSATQNVIITGNNLDWDCTDPQDANIAIDLHANGIGTLVVADNILRLSATDPSKSYQFLRLSGDSRGIPVSHVGNGYWVDTTVSGPSVIAASTSSPAYLKGCSLNNYNGFSDAQTGNVESTLNGS